MRDCKNNARDSLNKILDLTPSVPGKYKLEPAGQTLVMVHMLPPHRTGSIALRFNNIGPLVQSEAKGGGAIF